MASKRVSKKASILDPIFKLFYSIFEAPGGGSKWLPKSLQKRPRLQNSVFPPPEALQEPILTPSGLDFGASGS